MVTREQLKQEIDKVEVGHFDTLFRIIQSFEFPSNTSSSDPIIRKTETEEQSKESWLNFIRSTYGSFAADPLVREEQGVYEVRQDML